MSNYEAEIQKSIIEAVEFFFMDSKYGFEVARKNIEVVAPLSGGQAKSIEAFGRKPYDVGIYAAHTIVLFFEIKERKSDGNVPIFKVEQRDMLQTLAENGTDIRYAYNGWDFERGNRLEPEEVLRQAHVRLAQDMQSQIFTHPLLPSVILEEYLISATAQGSQYLVDILANDIKKIDALNSMPLMILANLDPQNSRILLDRTPLAALRMMKELFTLDESARAAKLNALAKKKNGAELQLMASEIFLLKDHWSVTNKKKMRNI